MTEANIFKTAYNKIKNLGAKELTSKESMEMIKNHYVYRITNKITNKHYYGIRTSKINPIYDIGFKYFSSSSDQEFIHDQKLNSINYKYKVIKIFNTRKEAIELEIKLHHKFNVGVNESFYNRAKQTSTGFDTTGTTYNHLSSTKKLIVLKRQLQVFDKKTKEKMGASNSIYKQLHGHGKKAYKIIMYDNNDNILFESVGTFKQDCEKNNISYNAARKSYVSNTKMYDKGFGGVKMCYRCYKGFYAVLYKDAK